MPNMLLTVTITVTLGYVVPPSFSLSFYSKFQYINICHVNVIITVISLYSIFNN